MNLPEEDEVDLEEETNKEWEIVTGDGSELEISTVGEHISSMKPKSKEEQNKRKIVIPEVKETEKNENSEKEENEGKD